eukprot:XP_001705208.1 Hypothetical protein GL50803_38692 [Giardia lamblia ATCC 50803]
MQQVCWGRVQNFEPSNVYDTVFAEAYSGCHRHPRGTCRCCSAFGVSVCQWIWSSSPIERKANSILHRRGASVPGVSRPFISQAVGPLC